MKYSPIVIICGPTATGKTDVGIRVSKLLNGSIISVDSRQLYRHMDIGTGKDIGKDAVFHPSDLHGTNRHNTIGYYELNGIPTWLYDIIPPDKTFSAYEYAELGRITINHLVNCSIPPVIVGGSGLYIKSLIDGIDTSPSPDWNLRKHYGNTPIHELQSILTSLHPKLLEDMNNSDKHNPHRLIRAIEKSLLQNQTIGQNNIRSISNRVIFIGLSAPLDVLYQRIEKRVDNRAQQGITDEIHSLLKKGYSWDDPGLTTVGYKEWRPFIEGMMSLNEAVSLWKLHERQYARRQLTWFKKDPRIQWFDIAKHSPDDIAERIVTLYNESLTH